MLTLKCNRGLQLAGYMYYLSHLIIVSYLLIYNKNNFISLTVYIYRY
jgi:hypothetical protein